MAKPPREMLSVLLRSGDGRVVPTNQQEEIGREATVEAPSAQTRKDYTSRPGALSRFFRMSRDGRKSKYKDLKATVKGYKNRLAHLTRSREQWRIRAERAGEQITTLAVEIAVLTTDYYPGNQDPHKSLQPIRSSNSRSRLPRDQRSTTESTEIHGKENPNQLPLSVSFCAFRGYAFVMIFLARSWGRASGVSRSGPDSVRAAPESSRRRAAGRYARARRAFNSSSLMALVNRRRQLGAICSNGATCTRASSRPLS